MGQDAFSIIVKKIPASISFRITYTLWKKYTVVYTVVGIHIANDRQFNNVVNVLYSPKKYSFTIQKYYPFSGHSATTHMHTLLLYSYFTMTM